ncbi:hypothetical protein PENSPDRAFT_646735 [Peniophora sp. CONT]|nr:hypothetical protein PENSPDRAFT_646735 [Peniophora sp. CONT]
MATINDEFVSNFYRLLLCLEPLTVEREGLSMQIKEARDRHSAIEEREARLSEYRDCHSAEREFMILQATHVHDASTNEGHPPAPHIQAAHTQFLLDVRGSLQRMDTEIGVLRELRRSLEEERAALLVEFEELDRVMQEFTGRQVDTMKAIVETVNSIPEDKRVAAWSRLTEMGGEEVVNRFRDFCMTHLGKDGDA